MKKSFGAKTILYPMPVFIIGTYNDDGSPNAMNAAWGGVANENTISICVDRSHKTAENLVKRKAFTVSIADIDNIVACDYVGIVSGNKVKDKVSKAGFHTSPSNKVDAPIIDELKLCLECELVSYDKDGSELLIGKIIDIQADESIIVDGKIDPSKLKPITYDPSNRRYLEIGNAVGNAFSDGKKIF